VMATNPWRLLAIDSSTMGCRKMNTSVLLG